MPVLKVIRVNIKAQAPLVISERRPDGQFRPSASYIPGAVWRGALAQQLLNAGASTDDESDFAALFTKDDAPLFRHAFPTRVVTTEGGDQYEAARPLPATAFSCKAESGFDRHGVYDSMIDRLCCEELGVEVPYLPRCNDRSHGGEGERVEAYGGFYVEVRKYNDRTERKKDSHKIERKGVQLPSHLTTRVAINRRRKVAEPNLLYSPLVISEAAANRTPTVFCGSIVLHEGQRALVEKSVEALTHIGSGAARGFGHIVVIPSEEMPADDLKERVGTFQKLVQKRWPLWAQVGDCKAPQHTPENGTFFAVMLLADAVLYADDWTPTVRLEPQMLSAALPDAALAALQDVALLRCYATAEYRGGWNTAWGLPKDTELAARMSSVYVFHSPRRADDEGLLSALRELEVRGVGERRNEGFGQVRVCDEFHLQVQNPDVGGEKA